MTTRAARRFVPSQFASAAAAEARLFARAAPVAIRQVAPIAAWAAASIVLGVIVGFAAVVLPPMGAIGIVAVVGVVLLWVMPDLPVVSTGLIRKTFFVMLVADLCVPHYYTIQVAGLPWISARRVATFALIAPFLLALAGSSAVRRRIMQRIRSSLLLFICAVGYLAMAFLSIFTSLEPTESLSSTTDAILSWYVPFLAMIYIINDSEDIKLILKVLCFCALFNAGAGILEFFLQHRYFLDIFPKSMLEKLLESDPAFADVLNSNPFRNGLYRASSTFVVSLSFADFEILVIPIGILFAVHFERLFDKALGWTVVFSGIFGIFCSGSRGGYIGFFASVAVFVTIWSMRKARLSRESLAPAIVGVLGVIAFATLIVLIITWRRAHNLVLGGGMEAYSTQGRWDQWSLGLPVILANPITGHGLSMGSDAIGWGGSIDSYYLSLLVETGVPGFVFFTGLLLLPIWYGVRRYLVDMSQEGAIAGALACSFVAFAVYRFALSQRENHVLFFNLLGILIVLRSLAVQQRAEARQSVRATRINRAAMPLARRA